MNSKQFKYITTSLSIILGSLLAVSSHASSLKCQKQVPEKPDTYSVAGSGVELLNGPVPLGGTPLKPRGGIAGSTIQLQSNYVLKVECIESGWARVRVIHPESLSKDHIGWVSSMSLRREPTGKNTSATKTEPTPNKNTSETISTNASVAQSSNHSTATQAQDKFTDADFTWDNKTRPYRKIIVAGVNKVYRENAKCKKIDPSSAYISGSKSTPSNPAFYVLCGEGNNVFQAYFSKSDIENGKVLSAKKHIDIGVAMLMCEDRAKRSLRHPSTYEYEDVISTKEHPNANTTVVLLFSGKNSYNLKLTYRIRCLVNTEGVQDAVVTESK